MLQKEAVINYQALKHNLKYFREKLGAKKLVACVKANAYGHGFSSVMPVLSQADACYVHSWDSAISLRRDYPKLNIILAGFIGNNITLQHLASENISWIVFCHEQLELMRNASFNGDTMDVWLKIDTGMNRLGFNYSEAEEIIRQLELMPWVREIILMTHYACAAEIEHPMNQLQLEKFTKLTEKFPSYQTSVGGTATALSHPDYTGDWVRVGAGLYGISPFINNVSSTHELKPVMQLRAKVISVKVCNKGDFVGYGATWQCQRACSRLAVLAIGYGDGYIRSIPAGAPVYINGKIAKVVGTISMDTTVVELDDDLEVSVGDWAELWGSNISVEYIASLAGTIGYELVTMVGRRVRRTLVEGV